MRSGAGVVAVVLALGAGCALTPPSPYPPPPGVERYVEGVDWAVSGDEAVQALAAYVRIDTSNPPGNETAGARYLAELLQRDGIVSDIYEFAPGRGSLVASLKGEGSMPPLCLLSHIDVVPAVSAEWDGGHGPFAGDVADGYVWGRGTLDMKGLGILELQTLRLLKRHGVRLTRDVILLAVADEEVQSGGMKHLLERWSEIGCSHVLNEGGVGLANLIFDGQTVYAISVAEKGLLWVRVIAEGEAGHGSTPLPERAPTVLLEALEAIFARRAEPSLHPALFEMLRAVGEERGGLNGWLLTRPTFAAPLVTGRLMAAPTTRAGVTNTCQLTGLSGEGSSPNVVPATASAVLDCRLLPGTSPASFLKELEELVKGKGRVRFEVLNEALANESPYDDPFFAALRRSVIAGRKGVTAGPVLSVGFTDSLFLRPLGVRAYGLSPFELEQEDLAGMHGPNERVSVANVRAGLRALFSAVVEVAARPP